MRSMSMLQLLGGVAVAGAVAAGATAVTGSGVVFGGTATASKFVGGTLTQTVTGASVTAKAQGKRKIIIQEDSCKKH